MPQAGEELTPLVVILGPTAVGKTRLSLELAQRFAGEIVSADSRLVYQGMDIGVAKPTPDEQALVAHHLLDMITPADTISLALYQRAAYDAIGDIARRGCLPLLVGGTGQYISAVIDGWQIPDVQPDAALRAEFEAFAADRGPAALWDRLKQVDAAAAERIHPNNVRRVIRALEVFTVVGTPISVLQQKKPPPYRVLQIGLTLPKADLHARIDARLELMMADGLVGEVEGLVAAGYDAQTPAMSGLGYRQIVTYLKGEATLEEAVDMIHRETIDFARRQDVWFRKYNKDAHWIEMTESARATIMALVEDWQGK